MTIAQIIVTTGGLVLMALLAWFFFGPKEARRAEMRGGVQEIDITVKGGYTPDLIRVRAGVRVRLVFDRQENSDCTSRVVFPDFGVSRSLAAFGKTAVEFVPTEAGEFGFACGMNMIHGMVLVEANGGAPVEQADSGDAIPPAAATTGNGHVHETARAIGVGPTREVETTRQVEFSLRGGGVTCPTCVTSIESILDRMPGVDRVGVNFGSERVTVDFDAEQAQVETMKAAITEAGYRVEERREPGSAETEDAEAEARRAEIDDLTRRVVLGAVLTAPVLFAVMATDFLTPPGCPRSSWTAGCSSA